ncbi:hypothetical protein [Jeotgalibaca porci]|uniref:hypothetical protein n=1 Tax=Jeotgalibaca porci TaxID=1868793 RepID=UPI0035A07631
MDGKLDIKDFKIVAMILTLFSLVAVGFVINSKIQESVMDEVELYRKAIKLENKKDMYDYTVETEQGNFITTTDIKSVENVKFPEMDKDIASSIISIERKEFKETYDMKTRTVTYTDSKGKTHSKTETYWEWVWHLVDTNVLGSPEIEIHGNKYKTSDFAFWYQELDASKLISQTNRSEYYTGPHHKFRYIAIIGGKLTVFAKAAGGTIKPVNGNKIAVFEKTYKEVTKDVEESPKIKSVFFVVICIIVTLTIMIIEYKFFYKNCISQQNSNR